MGATTVEVDSSHVVMISHPDEVTAPHPVRRQHGVTPISHRRRDVRCRSWWSLRAALISGVEPRAPPRDDSVLWRVVGAFGRGYLDRMPVWTVQLVARLEGLPPYPQRSSRPRQPRSTETRSAQDASVRDGIETTHGLLRGLGQRILPSPQPAWFVEFRARHPKNAGRLVHGRTPLRP